ncbi:Hypothetical predicted protein [Paramuricea clavata]|uniref:Uncharacterized protein n=1 Tax=Paramuricea clavata TaxID=317549 RepID=A0A6S7JEB5_PARCT|nr:Hypothetical predicted protein [Paramuricea clavata]
MNQMQQRKKNSGDLRKDLIKCKHRDYLAKIKHSLVDNPKLFWSYHKAIHSSKCQSTVLTHDNKIATTIGEKVQLFNLYFSSVFGPKLDLDCLLLSNEPRTDMQIFEIQLEVNEVYEYLRTLDTTKAHGPDGIPACILKDVLLCVLFSINHLKIAVFLTNGKSPMLL